MRKKYGGAFGLTDEGIKQLQKYLVVLDGIETRRAEMVKSASRDEVASIDRDAMIFALDVVEVILSCLTGTTRSAMPVLKLQLALKDLRDGNRVPAILQSAKRRGKPPLDTTTQLWRASVAAAVYRQEQNIGDVDAAAKLVLANIPNEIKLALSDKPVTWKMLRQWRWEFASTDASETASGKHYHAPSTPYERVLAHPKAPAAVKQRLRNQYRTLDPVALLAEIRAAQEELGNRIDRRAGDARCQQRAGKGIAPQRVQSSTPDAVAFAKTLGTTIEVRDPRATHRRPKRPYKTRIRMPSKLDPHVATIEDWLAAEPQLTALAIVGRLSERHPEQFGTKQHSTVQRLLKTLRKKAAEKLIAQEPPRPAMTAAPLPGAVDGSGYEWPDPPTAPPVEQASEVDRPHRSVHVGSSAPTAPPG